MRNYDSMINELLQGETPKERYDFLVWLLNSRDCSQVNKKVMRKEEFERMCITMRKNKSIKQKCEKCGTAVTKLISFGLPKVDGRFRYERYCESCASKEGFMSLKQINEDRKQKERV